MKRKLLICIIVIAVVASGVTIGILHSRSSPEDDAEGWEIVRRRQIGDGILTFFRLLPESTNDTMNDAPEEMEQT